MQLICGITSTSNCKINKTKNDYLIASLVDKSLGQAVFATRGDQRCCLGNRHPNDECKHAENEIKWHRATVASSSYRAPVPVCVCGTWWVIQILIILIEMTLTSSCLFVFVFHSVPCITYLLSAFDACTPCRVRRPSIDDHLLLRIINAHAREWIKQKNGNDICQCDYHDANAVSQCMWNLNSEHSFAFDAMKMWSRWTIAGASIP